MALMHLINLCIARSYYVINLVNYVVEHIVKPLIFRVDICVYITRGLVVVPVYDLSVSSNANVACVKLCRRLEITVNYVINA
jgi:hypothetical protein